MPKSKTNYFIIIQGVLLFLLFAPIIYFVIDGVYYNFEGFYREIYLLSIYSIIILVTILYFLRLKKEKNKFWFIFLPLSFLSIIFIISPQLLIAETISIESSSENWKEFVYENEGFKAVFPSNFLISPQPEFYQIKDDKTSFYTTQGENNLSYFIITSPCENCDNPLIQQESLRKHLNYLSSSIDVDDTSPGTEELLYSTNEYFLDYPAIKFLIKDKAMNVYSKGYLFSANQKIYTIMVMFIGGFYNDIDYQKFMDSFQLLSVYE